MATTAVDPHTPAPSSPAFMVSSFWTNRGLIQQMITRELQLRYRGSILGVTWAFLHPCLILTAYTFAFNVVFRAQWSATQTTSSDFALNMFVGIIIYGFFAECIGRAPTLITSNVTYVKKVVFPLQILAFSTSAAALVQLMIGLGIWIAVAVLIRGTLFPTVLIVPVLVLPILLYTIGLIWLFSALGVFVRDMSQGINVITMVAMFVSPIFYPTERLPPAMQPWMSLNPLANGIESVRGAVLQGETPGLAMWGGHLLCGFAVASIGFLWFQKTRRGFADVI